MLRQDEVGLWFTSSLRMCLNAAVLLQRRVETQQPTDFSNKAVSSVKCLLIKSLLIYAIYDSLCWNSSGSGLRLLYNVWQTNKSFV